MEQINENDYIKGFNEGYLISKDLPELGAQLLKVELLDSRGEGMRDGIEQFNLEKSLNRIPDSFKVVKPMERNIDPSKDLDKEK